MRDVNAKSSRALVWTAFFLLLMGAAVGAPSGAVFLLVIGALCALVPVVRGPRGPRLAGTMVLALAVLLAVAQMPAAIDDLRAWQAHARSSGTR